MKKMLLLSAAAATLSLAGAEVLINDNFSANAPAAAAPAGWNVYAKITELNTIVIKDLGGEKREVAVTDADEQNEIGLTRVLPAVPGKFYRFSAKLRRNDDANSSTPAIQIRFLPSNKFKQINTTAGIDNWSPNSVSMQAPEGTESVQVFVYTFKPTKAAYSIGALMIEESDADFGDSQPWPPEDTLALESSFTDAKINAKTKLPVNWVLYKQGPDAGTVELTPEGVKMSDQSASSEIGLTRTFAAKPGSYFRASVRVKTLENKPAGDSGFLLQVSFWKAKVNKQAFFKNTPDFTEYTVTGQIPADDPNGTIYLYSHKAPTNTVVLQNFKFEVSPNPFN